MGRRPEESADRVDPGESDARQPERPPTQSKLRSVQTQWSERFYLFGDPADAGASCPESSTAIRQEGRDRAGFIPTGKPQRPDRRGPVEAGGGPGPIARRCRSVLRGASFRLVLPGLECLAIPVRLRSFL